MCNFREAELKQLIEAYQRVINRYIEFPQIVNFKVRDINRLRLRSLQKHIADIEPDTLIMVSVKDLNLCDLAIVGQSVVFAPNIEITASELINILDKGECK